MGCSGSGCGAHALGRTESPGVSWGWGTQHSCWIGASELESEAQLERAQAALGGAVPKLSLGAGFWSSPELGGS